MSYTNCIPESLLCDTIPVKCEKVYIPVRELVTDQSKNIIKVLGLLQEYR